MKLVAHSLVPPSPVPYLHLGYVSAAAYETTWHPPGYGFITGGALLAALLGIIIFRKGISPVARRNGRGIMLTGFVVLGLAQIPWPSRYVDPEFTTHDHAWKVYQRIDKRRMPGDPITTDLRAFAKQFGDYSTDGWNREMRIVKFKKNGSEVFAVVSAGRDGKFGTGDDIAVTEGSPSMYSRKYKAIIPGLTDALVKGR